MASRCQYAREMHASSRIAGLGVYLPERGFGVRIEDEVVVTETGYRNLSSRIPRKLEDVEAWVAAARR